MQLVLAGSRSHWRDTWKPDLPGLAGLEVQLCLQLTVWPRTQAEAEETEENFSRARILNVGSKCLKETGAQGM